MKKGQMITIACIYAALVLVFALSNLLGWKDYKLIMALPVFFLSGVTFLVGKGRGANYWLPLALLLSAVADFFGARQMFLPQIGIFAAVHIAYFLYFIRGSWLRPSLLLFCLLVAGIGIGLGFLIVPNVEAPVERGFVVGYIFIICIMCMSVILWSKENKSWYVAAAILFMFSDMAIGINKYVTPVPYSSLIIMSTYYAAQLIFGMAYLSRFLRHRKFNPAIRA